MDATPEPPAGSRWLRPGLAVSWREVIIVMLLTTGYFLASSAWEFFHDSSRRFYQMILTDRSLLAMVVKESAILGLTFIYLRRRGWTPADFRIRINPSGTFLGIALPIPVTIAHMVTVFSLFALAYIVGGDAELMGVINANKPDIAPHSVHVTWAAIIVACIVNAYLEEIICTAYFFNQVAARHGPFAALLLTDMVRMSYHIYQGAFNMLGIGAVFLVLNGCYWWTRNLWPLILAHTIIDIFGMGFIKELFS